jgi:hypothetical protein
MEFDAWLFCIQVDLKMAKNSRAGKQIFFSI